MKKLTAAVQESLVALLCYDNSPQGARAVASMVPPKTYDPYFRELAAEALQYISQYGKAPGEHTYDLIESLKERKPDEAKTWDRIHYSLQRTKDTINREFVLNQAGVFIRRQNAKAIIQKAMPLLLKEDPAAIDQAEALLLSVGKKSAELTSPGTLLNDPEQALKFLDEEEEEAMPTGIKELDRLRLGPVRKETWMAVAPTNAGKTWLAIQKGKHSLIHGKRVLHVTLEMSESKICMRYSQALFAVTKRKSQEVFSHRFQTDELGRFIGLDMRPIKGRPSLDDPNIREFLYKRLKGLARRPSLYVKQFPTGQLTVDRLRSYLDWLEGVRKFLPDLIMVDYPELMELSGKEYRHQLDAIHKGLRGIAVERNAAMAVYSQSNKLGLTTKVMGLGKSNEDFRKEHTADTIVTYNQTPAEYKLGLARLFVAKARNDEKNIQVLLSQVYGIGQFSLDSCKMMDSNYWPLVSKDDPEDLED